MIDYFLVCKKHRQAVFITDSNGNPPRREEVTEFLRKHVNEGCKVEFVSDHELDEMEEIEFPK